MGLLVKLFSFALQLTQLVLLLPFCAFLRGPLLFDLTKFCLVLVVCSFCLLPFVLYLFFNFLLLLTLSPQFIAFIDKSIHATCLAGSLLCEFLQCLLNLLLLQEVLRV